MGYFVGGDCEGAATTGVGLRGPYFHGKTSTASQAYPSYNSGDDCQRSVVDRCIPGHADMCDKPNVHLGGGKGVVRDTSNGSRSGLQVWIVLFEASVQGGWPQKPVS